MIASWHRCKWVMEHIWMSHVTHMSWIHVCDTYEWVMWHICHESMCVTHMNESCDTYVMNPCVWHKSCRTSEWVMARIWMSHGTHMMDESWHTYNTNALAGIARCISLCRKNVSVHTCQSTHVNESWHTYEWKSCDTYKLNSLAGIARRLSLCRKNVSCHTPHTSRHTLNESWHAYKWVMSHIWPVCYCRQDMSHLPLS